MRTHKQYSKARFLLLYSTVLHWIHTYKYAPYGHIHKVEVNHRTTRDFFRDKQNIFLMSWYIEKNLKFVYI